ncbi:MAG: hypothetical protein D3923_18400, partial [Candidatus Electrothrix sp. AR3]|nr:hypothetical protein [Candidatus Electrothrix sp. AR3]
KKIEDRFCDQNSQANRHRMMHRSLWILSSIISIAIAFLSSGEFSCLGISSISLSKYLAILLPVVTGYVVLRNPEKLWVAEINTRNKLADLSSEIELILDRGGDINREVFEKRYLDIMRESNERWVEIRGE